MQGQKKPWGVTKPTIVITIVTFNIWLQMWLNKCAWTEQCTNLTIIQYDRRDHKVLGMAHEENAQKPALMVM